MLAQITLPAKWSYAPSLLSLYYTPPSLRDTPSLREEIHF